MSKRLGMFRGRSVVVVLLQQAAHDMLYRFDNWALTQPYASVPACHRLGLACKTQQLIAYDRVCTGRASVNEFLK